MVFIIMPVGGGFSLCVYEESRFLYFTYRCVGQNFLCSGASIVFVMGRCLVGVRWFFSRLVLVLLLV